mmetsp:Transcript_24123/g.52500  ORF Transcript_24123/g.52500 Transcript_24123/m.52500 type:complete len:138 (-) Transcript_24123:1302-1715(-)
MSSKSAAAGLSFGIFVFEEVVPALAVARRGEAAAMSGGSRAVSSPEGGDKTAGVTAARACWLPPAAPDAIALSVVENDEGGEDIEDDDDDCRSSHQASLMTVAEASSGNTLAVRPGGFRARSISNSAALSQAVAPAS